MTEKQKIKRFLKAFDVADWALNEYFNAKKDLQTLQETFPHPDCLAAATTRLMVAQKIAKDAVYRAIEAERALKTKPYLPEFWKLWKMCKDKKIIP